MTLLILGIALWMGAHFLKRLAPGLRAALGENRGKGIVSLVLLVSIVLMVWGYRVAEFVPVYTPLPGMGHANNLIVLIALFFFASANMKGVTASKVRHNMLTGTILWAGAHLMVNGDLAAIILFGGMILWALISMLLINRAGPWKRPAAGPIMNDVKALIGSVVLYAVIAGIQWWLGYNPFLGTYG
jgi:uncharacterized membrane protein